MRKTNEQTLKEVINELLDAYMIKNKLNSFRLANSWEKLMGKTISNRTRNVYLKDKKLYISLNSAALKEELHYQKEKIIDLLNKAMNEELIDEVVLL